MLRPIRLNPRLRDPIQLQQVAKYQGNLTVTSNDTNIIPRDDAGNVQLQEESTTNPLLIIEPVATRITLDSVLKVLDTQFQYFKFPATVRVIDTPQIDVDLTIPELDDITTQDIVYARYKPSEEYRISATNFSGILMDDVVDGQLQQNINGYFITKEIKNSGKDLRFRIKLQHKYQVNPAGFVSNDRIGTVEFSLILNSPDRGLNRTWKGPFVNTLERNLIDGTSFELDLLIRNEEFEIGETISIAAKSGQNTDTAYHFIIADQTYWVITDAEKNVDEWNQEIANDNTI